MPARTMQQLLDDRQQDPETLAELTGEGRNMELFVKRLMDRRGISPETLKKNRTLKLPNGTEIVDPVRFLEALADTLNVEATDIEFLNPEGNFTLSQQDIEESKDRR